jgi:tetratricopeptide (TPR) repeat protein
MIATIGLRLASEGYRVLVIDRDREAPSLYRYLAAFLPLKPGAGEPSSPIRLTCQFADPRGALDFFGPTGPTDSEPADHATAPTDLTRQGYDHVLVNTPTNRPAAALASEQADTLVLGFALSPQALEKARDFALAVQRGDRGPDTRILPIPLQVDQRAGAVTEKMRLRARRQFAWLGYRGEIEIPYEPDYAVEEGIPLLDDFSDQRTALVRGYVQLAALLAPDPSPAAEIKVTDETRARYRAARLAAATDGKSVTVLSAAADRHWAEWLVSALRGMGLTAARRRIDQEGEENAQASSELLVVSEHLLALPGLDGYLAAAQWPSDDGDQLQLGVSIDDSRLPNRQFPVLGYADLAGKDEPEARDAIASFFELAGSVDATSDPRDFPGRSEPNLSNLPPRRGTCYGRDDAIDVIRDHFTSGDWGVPLTLTGPPGIGKGELATEYAHRFAGYYDLVFRLHADSVPAVTAGLAELARLMPPEHPGGDEGLAALGDLQSPTRPAKRWLLIYVGVDDLAALAGLLPTPGHGHVLLTARGPVAEASRELAVGPLALRNASEMVMEFIPEIQPEDAATIATTLGGIPLALRLAAGWLRVTVPRIRGDGAHYATATANAVRELTERLADADGPAAADPVRAVIELLLDLLTSAERGDAARLLLETCAFLAPVGLSRRLLRSSGMLAQLAEVDEDSADPVVLQSVLRALVSHGFCPKESQGGPLRVHPRVLEILRQQMSPEDRARRTHAVTAMLASSAPLDVDDDLVRYAEIYNELLLHVAPSGAFEETSADVRRWLVSQVRFLYQLETVGAWKAAADVAERLVPRWAAEVGDNDPLLLRLRTQLANVYRSQCRFNLAFTTDHDVLMRQRRTLGLSHPRTLMTARSYGADLRLVGEFEDALFIDRSTWETFARDYGDDHLLTIIASSNLALSQLMFGDPEQALERQLRDIGRARRIRSEQPWREPWVQLHVGTLYREIGLFTDSRTQLRQAKEKFRDLVDQDRIAPTMWAVLRTTAGLAITERRLGQPDLDTTRSTLVECESTYGERYPDVMALYLSLAGDLHETGRHDEAVKQAEIAWKGYSEVFGPEHPFTRICEVDLSIYALAAGQQGKADEMSQAAVSSFTDQLASGHLWLLAAQVARANVLVAAGRFAEALRLEEEALEAYKDRLGPYNPLTSIAGINASITRMLLNEPSDITDPEQELNRRNAIELDAPPY